MQSLKSSLPQHPSSSPYIARTSQVLILDICSNGDSHYMSSFNHNLNHGPSPGTKSLRVRSNPLQTLTIYADLARSWVVLPAHKLLGEYQNLSGVHAGDVRCDFSLTFTCGNSRWRHCGYVHSSPFQGRLPRNLVLCLVTQGEVALRDETKRAYKDRNE